MKLFFIGIQFLLFSHVILAADALLTDAEEGFVRFFERILHKVAEDIHVEVGATTVRISSKKANIDGIKTSLSHIFACNENFFNHLGYSVEGAIIWKDTNKKRIDAANHKPTSLQEAITYLKKVFGENMFKKLALTSELLFDESEGAKFENGILYTKKFSLDDLDVCKKYAKSWLASVANLSVGDIRRSICTEEPAKASSKPLDSKKNYHICGLFQGSCAVLKSEDEAQIFFDTNYIHDLVMLPVIKTEQGPNQKTLVIDRQHLMTYLKQLSSNGILLHIFEAEGKKYAHPIIVAEKPRQPKPAFHYFIIDRSESIEKHYSTISSILNRFIDSVLDTNYNSKIKLIFFSTGIDKIIEMPFRDKEAIKSAILDPGTKFGDETHLYDAVNEAILEIQKNNMMKKYRVTMTIITDGQDKNSKLSTREFQKAVEIVPIQQRPAIFTFGFGEADQKKLERLAASCVSPYIKCNGVQDLEILHNHMETFTHDQEIYEFFGKMVNDQQLSLSIPVLKNNSLKPVKVVFPLSNNEVDLTIQGQQLTVRLNQHQEVKKASVADKIYLLRSKAETIDRDKDLMPGKKQIEFGKILTELTGLAIARNADARLREQVVAEIRALSQNYLD